MTDDINSKGTTIGHAADVNNPRPGASRIRRLDSVRALAAIMVLIAHTVGTGSMPWWMGVFWDSSDAVIMFFLLSGYVLALQLTSPSRPTYAGFVVRRFCRIWPAFAVSIVISFLLLWAMHAGGLSARLPNGLNDPNGLTARSLFLNLLMAKDDNVINPPVWSLFTEMRASMVFPLIMLLVLRMNFYAAVFGGIAFSVLVSKLANPAYGAVAVDVGTTGRFLCLFVIGAALACPDNPCERLYARLPAWARAGALLLAVAFLECRFVPVHVPARNYIPWLGVVPLFVICLYSPTAQRMLDRGNQGVLAFLGRISYGIYLVHYPIVVLLQSTVLLSISPWLQLPIDFLVTVVVSHALNVLVEKPMMKIGRNLSPPAAIPI